MHRRQKVVTLALCLVLSLCGAVPALAFAFVDVPQDHWAYSAVDKLAAAGLLEGDPGQVFEGRRTLTRYEFAQLIWRVWEKIEARLGELEQRTPGQAVEQTVAPVATTAPAAPAALEGLPPAQTGEVVAVLQNLVTEFRPELEANGVAARRLQATVDTVVKQVTKLSAAQNNQQASLEARLAQIEQSLAALKAQLEQKPGAAAVSSVDGRVQALEQAAASLRAELDAIKAQQAALSERLARREKVNVGGALEVKFLDTSLAGNTAKAWLDPADPDYDKDALNDRFLSDRYFREELSLNLGFTPAPGAQLVAKVKGLRYDLDNGNPGDHQVRLGLTLQTPGALKLLAVDQLSPEEIASGFTPLTLDAERLTKKLTDPVDHDTVEPLEGALGKVESGPLSAKGLLVYNYPLAGPGNTGLMLALRPTLNLGPALRVGATYVKQPDDPLSHPDVVETDASGRVGAFGYQVESAASGSDFAEQALHGKLTGDFGAVKVELEKTRFDDGFAPAFAREWDKDRSVEADPDSLWNPGRAEARGAVALTAGRGMTFTAEAGRRDQQLATDDYYTWRKAGLAFPLGEFHTEGWLKTTDNSSSRTGDPSLAEQYVSVAWRNEGATAAERPAMLVLADRETAQDGTLRSLKRWAEAYREGRLGAGRVFGEADWGLFTDATVAPKDGGPISDRAHYRVMAGLKEVPFGAKAAFDFAVSRARNDYDPDPDPALKDPEWRKWTTNDVTTASAGLSWSVGRGKVGLIYQFTDTTAADKSPQSNTAGLSLDLPLVDQASLFLAARQTSGSRGERYNYGDLALKYPVGDLSLIGAVQFRSRSGAYLSADNYQARKVVFSGVYSF